MENAIDRSNHFASVVHAFAWVSIVAMQGDACYLAPSNPANNVSPDGGWVHGLQRLGRRSPLDKLWFARTFTCILFILSKEPVANYYDEYPCLDARSGAYPCLCPSEVRFLKTLLMH